MSKKHIKNIQLTLLLAIIVSYPLVTIALPLGNDETIVAVNTEPIIKPIIIENTNVKVINERVGQENDLNNGAVDNKPKYDTLVRKYSKQYNVSYALMSAIIDTENTDREYDLQSKLLYSFTNERLGIIKGEREYSFGLVQINLHYNSNITYEQATDPDFSIELLAKWISNGNVTRWGSYTNGSYKKHLWKYQ